MSYQFRSNLVISFKEWKPEEITLGPLEAHEDKPYLQLIPLFYHGQVFQLRTLDMIVGSRWNQFLSS